MSVTEPVTAWAVGAELGEGPVWVKRDGALWFTDIKRRRIHRYRPDGGTRSWDAPEQVGFVLPAADGGFVAGLQSGLHRFDQASGAFALIAPVDPELPENRLNDAAVDPSGRLWFGTMDDGETARTGRVYRFHRGSLEQAEVDQVPITNGPAVSPDGRILYHVDTLGRTLHAADVGEDGRLGPSRPFVTIPPGEGNPDGPSVDAEGCVWVGLYGGWEARRYSPAGELVERVRFPVSNVTKVAFGGEDLRTAYATTARHLLNAEALEQQPEAGNLFEFRVDVPGAKPALIAL